MVSRVRFGTERRRFASLMRRVSTNSAGALPNKLLKARLKWLGDMHAFRASVLTERSSCKFRMIQYHKFHRRSQRRDAFRLRVPGPSLQSFR